MAKDPKKKNSQEEISADVETTATVKAKPKKYYKFKKSIFDGNDTFEGGVTYCLSDELAEKYKDVVVEDDLSVTPPHTVKCGCKDKK